MLFLHDRIMNMDFRKSINRILEERRYFIAYEATNLEKEAQIFIQTSPYTFLIPYLALTFVETQSRN